MRKKILYSLVAAMAVTSAGFGYHGSTAIKADTVRYEAEDAEIHNAKTASSVEGYSGTGYLDGLKESSDYIEFTVNAPKAGNYKLGVCYCAPYGYKQEKFVVNGSASFQVSFEENSSFEKIDAGVVKLNAGENTIRMERSWGWTLIDYIELSPVSAADLGIYTDVTDDLINPNATKATKKVMSFLASEYGKHMLSGQFAYTTKYTEIDAIHNQTGKYPAVLGLDFSDYSPSRVALGCNPGQDTEKAIDWWNNGGLVTFCWHWQSPIGASTDSSKKWGGFYTENTTYDLAKAMSDHTSEEYTTLIRDIDAIAVQLQKLQDAGVPVLWRPLHEASGGWFWWGAAGSEPYKELWKLMYDRLTNYHGLNNLIWVWNGQDADWYPGDEYVDIIGEDIYADKQDYSSQSNGFLKCLKYTTAHKMITLSENGVLPDPDELQSDGIPWSWNNTWGGEFVVPWVGSTDYTETYTSKDELKKFYDSDYVLTRDELPSSLFEEDEEDKMKVSLTGVADGDTFDDSTSYSPIILGCTTQNADGAEITYYVNNKEIGTGDSASFTPSGTTTNADGYEDYTVTVRVVKSGKVATDTAVIKVKLPITETTPSTSPDPSASPEPSASSQPSESTDSKDVSVSMSQAGETSGNISLNMELTNNGSTSLDLSKLEICYYYKNDSNTEQTIFIDHNAAQLPSAPWYVDLTADTIRTIVTMPTPMDTADRYVSLKFNNETSVVTGGKVVIQGRVANKDWSAMDLTNDYSAKNGILVYYDGQLIYGQDVK